MGTPPSETGDEKRLVCSAIFPERTICAVLLLSAVCYRARSCYRRRDPVIASCPMIAILTPHPPLAEQRRSVAKLEQLLAMVDALETQPITYRSRLTETVSLMPSTFIVKPPLDG